MNILVFDQQEALSISQKSVESVVKHVLKEEKQHTDEVAVYFVSTEEISRLHKAFFNDPSITDCISFPLDQEDVMDYHILGEIFICPKTALDYVGEANADCYRETTLYLIHGLLHLLGYDDIQDQDLKSMRRAERRLMKPLIQQKLFLQPK